MIVYNFVRLVSYILSGVLTLIAPVNLMLGVDHTPVTRAKEDCKLSFATISDIHLRENFNLIFEGMLDLGLSDMENAEDRFDAVVFDGDITDGGEIGQWDVFSDALSRYDIADNVFIVTGNHDTWGPYDEDAGETWDDPEKGFKNTFIKYNKSITNRDITEMYYSDTVNGYPFIVLGAEEDHTWAFISDEQIRWLDSELQKASATGLPIFVFIHQPVNETHGLPYNWELDETHPADKGGIGEQSSSVVDVLKKYDNIFYVSGHIHAGFKNEDSKIGVEYASVEYLKNNNGNNITLINLPSYMYFDFLRGGHLANGCGWVVEAYENEVLIRARNFGTGSWLPKYDVTVPIVK